MAPYFEQYTSALRRGIEKVVAQETEEISSTQAEIERLTQVINGAQQQLVNFNGVITEKQGKVGNLNKSIHVFDGLPQVDIFVPGPENIPVALSDFAKQVIQEKLESTTESSQESADKKLESLFEINLKLKSSGIDTARQISLDSNGNAQAYNYDPSRKHEIQIDGKTVMLNAR